MKVGLKAKQKKEPKPPSGLKLPKVPGQVVHDAIDMTGQAAQLIATVKKNPALGIAGGAAQFGNGVVKVTKGLADAQKSGSGNGNRG